MLEQMNKCSDNYSGPNPNLKSICGAVSDSQFQELETIYEFPEETLKHEEVDYIEVQSQASSALTGPTNSSNNSKSKTITQNSPLPTAMKKR
jgi:hypothetical protein